MAKSPAAAAFGKSNDDPAQRLSILGLIAAAMVLAGCGGVCPTVYDPGLMVTVVDDATGAAICDATVLAKDGSDEESLPVNFPGPSCDYSGAGAGTWDVSASKSGYQTATQSAVRVDEAACGPNTAMVMLRLKH
jgi:hypothetical protein